MLPQPVEGWPPVVAHAVDIRSHAVPVAALLSLNALVAYRRIQRARLFKLVQASPASNKPSGALRKLAGIVV